MSFVYDANGIAHRDFGQQEDFTSWIFAQTERVQRHFPTAIDKINEIGPLAFSRWATDNPDLIAAKLYEALPDLVGWRVTLDAELPIIQIESADKETDMVAQWSIAPRAVLDRVDQIRAGDGSRVASTTKLPAELVASSAQLAAVGVSGRLDVSQDSGAARFAGFCPVCDGVLQTTGARVDDRQRSRVLWEEQCLGCARRSVGWKAAW